MALLTRLLLDQGMIDYAGVEEGIKAQVIYGGRIGANLVDMGLITEQQLCKTLEKSYGIPGILLDESNIDPLAVKAIPEKFIRQHKVFPFAKKRIAVSLAMRDPSKRSIIADISFSTGFIIKPYVTPEHRLDLLLERYFEIPSPWRYTESYEEDVFPEDIQEALNKPVEKLSPEEARRRLSAAQHGKEIPNAILGYARGIFQRALLFVVRHDKMLALDGFSPPRKAGFAEGYSIDLKEPSVFADAVRTGTPFIGPLPERAVEEDAVDFLGGEMPATAFVAPIVLRGRVVNILYADAGPHKAIESGMSETMVFLNQAVQAYERLIKARLDRSLKETKDV
jgi:hypothetical protein